MESKPGFFKCTFDGLCLDVFPAVPSPFLHDPDTWFLPQASIDRMDTVDYRPYREMWT